MRFRAVLRIAAWHIFLYCFVIFYILIGATVFHYLEGETEVQRHFEQSRLIQQYKKNFVKAIQQDLWDKIRIERHLRSFLENISRISTLENYLLFDDASRHIYDNNKRVNHKMRTFQKNTLQHWTFSSSVLFAFTILTTIGYGNVVPTTTICQVFTMIYGAFGIPLFLITLADAGRFFKTFIIHLIESIYGREIKKQKTERKLLREIGEVVFVAILLFTFIAVGSAVLPLWEHELTYFNSVYFSYMSLTTIGLGDIVPRRMDFLFPTLIYITIGLWLTTVMVEQLADVFRLVHYAGRHVSNVKSIKVWLGGHQVSIGSLINTVCRRVGMADNFSGRINWDTTIERALNGETQTLLPIFPWHFSDFLFCDPPLIDEECMEETDFAKFNNNTQYLNNYKNKLRLSPPRLTNTLRHTVSARPPEINDLILTPLQNRRNLSAPLLNLFDKERVGSPPEINVSSKSALIKSITVRATPANTVAYVDRIESNKNVFYPEKIDGVE